MAVLGCLLCLQACAGAVLQSQLSESRTDEQVRLERLLPDRPEGHRRTTRLLTGLGSMVQADLLRHQPTRIAWPADMAQHATQLFGSLDLFDPVADIASSFLWRVLNKACHKLGCPLELHFMSWVRNPGNNQIRYESGGTAIACQTRRTMLQSNVRRC